MPDFADHRDNEKDHLRGEMPCLRRWFNTPPAHFSRCPVFAAKLVTGQLSFEGRDGRTTSNDYSAAPGS
jgi:hypothetical protein